jgi:hypothetical protein
MLSDPSIARYLGNGMVIVVGTVDAGGWPVTCRAAALVGQEGDGRVTVYLPVATSAETIANVANSGRVAIVSSCPGDHGTIQLKGRSCGVRLAGESEAELVAAQVERLAEVLEAVGVPRRVTKSLAAWPAFAVEVQVESVFDQTPGPRAGARLKGA